MRRSCLFCVVFAVLVRSKKGGEVESLASHYIACVFVSRLLMMSFWMNSYPELKPKGADFNLPGFGVRKGSGTEKLVAAGLFWCG